MRFCFGKPTSFLKPGGVTASGNFCWTQSNWLDSSTNHTQLKLVDFCVLNARYTKLQTYRLYQIVTNCYWLFSRLFLFLCDVWWPQSRLSPCTMASNFYSVLCVSQRATVDEIRQAFRRRALEVREVGRFSGYFDKPFGDVLKDHFSFEDFEAELQLITTSQVSSNCSKRAVVHVFIFLQCVLCCWCYCTTPCRCILTKVAARHEEIRKRSRRSDRVNRTGWYINLAEEATQFLWFSGCWFQRFYSGCASWGPWSQSRIFVDYFYCPSFSLKS